MITKDLESRLLAAWRALPEGVRSPPATPHEIAAVERDLGPLPDDFRWFLTHLGGGVVGAVWVDNVSELRASHAKFDAERANWTLEGCFVVGWDGAGNPMAIDVKTGKVVVEDHNFGGIHELSPTFTDFLANGVLGAGQ